jgi:glycosyltransferase involved in cell wall biosynthesis
MGIEGSKSSMKSKASKNSHPLISIVMPVYNRERYVADAIHSILNQTYSPLELIVVVDNGSTDRSADIVRDLAAQDSRVRPLFLSHGSQWRARNAGVAIAKGEYIAHMDDDDIALPERLAVQLSWMQRNGVDICGGSLKKFGAADGLIWFPETHQAICHELLFRITIFLPTALIRADIAKAYPYDETLVYSDYAWLTQLAHRYRFGNMPQILIKCLYHEDQIHIVHGADFRRDERLYRQPFFQSLFPEATADDLRVIALLAERKSFESPEDLKRAGIWLIRLADTPDNFIRQRMADRWRSACMRSAHLGLGCYHLYRKIAPQFGISSVSHMFELKLACALRLKAGSRLEALLKKISKTLRQGK